MFPVECNMSRIWFPSVEITCLRLDSFPCKAGLDLRNLADLSRAGVAQRVEIFWVMVETLVHV